MTPSTPGIAMIAPVAAPASRAATNGAGVTTTGNEAPLVMSVKNGSLPAWETIPIARNGVKIVPSAAMAAASNT